MIEKTVQTAMSDTVATVSPDASATDAANLLRRREVGSLVGVAADAAVGFVAESDFVALVGEGADPATPVCALMSAPVVSVTPERSLADAATTTSGLYRVESPAMINCTFSPGSTANWATNAMTSTSNHPVIARSPPSIPPRLDSPHHAGVIQSDA